MRAIVLVFSLFALPALAQTPCTGDAAKGAEILKAFDVALNASDDMEFVYSMANLNRQGEPTDSMTLKVWVKDELRKTEFVEPSGALTGTKALVRGGEMWVWLPAYNKVRKISSSLTEGGFMGTTFSNEDMATTHYTKVYDGCLVGEDDGNWIVEATPNGSKAVPYAKLKLWIGKGGESKDLASKIEYYREVKKEVRHAKTEERGGFSCQAGGSVCTAATMKMIDHTKNGIATLLSVQPGSWKVNPGLDDGMFDVSSLN